ncbi:MAG: hypothetical protein Q8J64_03115 [Thermodesulfovibrionales bacterium]|nr:hypothetical protein [Thermodesulfovibrionales bacterium]
MWLMYYGRTELVYPNWFGQTRTGGGGVRAEKKFKRVQGYREIPKLIAALGQKNLDRKEEAA